MDEKKLLCQNTKKKLKNIEQKTREMKDKKYKDVQKRRDAKCKRWVGLDNTNLFRKKMRNVSHFSQNMVQEYINI